MVLWRYCCVVFISPFLFLKSEYKIIVQVCSGRVLKIFRPEELMAMVVGNEEYDWQALELNCEYKNGYTSSDETVSI